MNGCPNGDGISSVIVPTFVVQAKDSKVYSFSILTECREAVYSIVESYTWVSITTDAGTSLASIKVAPIANSDEGTYTLTLQMKLANYPTAPTITTTF